MSTNTPSKKRNFWLTSLIAVPLGAVLTYLGMSLIFFDFGVAFGILIFSIICTLGISLVLWVPIWWLVGYIPIVIFRRLRGTQNATEPNEEEAGSTVSLSNDQRALLNYVRKAVSKGLSKESIVQNLQTNGWAIENINWAINTIKSEGATI